VEGEPTVETLAAHAARLKEAATRQPDPAEWVPMSQHKAVAEELARIQAEIAAEKAEAAVRAAMSAGKLAPAMKDWALDYAKRDPAGFSAFVEKAPVIVSADAPVAAHSVAQNADALSDEERYVCAALGISESDFAAHKRAVVKE
jgi:phage I-like protein